MRTNTNLIFCPDRPHSDKPAVLDQLQIFQVNYIILMLGNILLGKSIIIPVFMRGIYEAGQPYQSNRVLANHINPFLITPLHCPFSVPPPSQYSLRRYCMPRGFCKCLHIGVATLDVHLLRRQRSLHSRESRLLTRFDCWHLFALSGPLQKW